MDHMGMFEEQGHVEMERVRSRRVVFTWSIEAPLQGCKGEERVSALMSLRVVQISSVLYIRLLTKISFAGRKKSKESSKRLLWSVF